MSARVCTFVHLCVCVCVLTSLMYVGTTADVRPMATPVTKRPSAICNTDTCTHRHIHTLTHSGSAGCELPEGETCLKCEHAHLGEALRPGTQERAGKEGRTRKEQRSAPTKLIRQTATYVDIHTHMRGVGLPSCVHIHEFTCLCVVCVRACARVCVCVCVPAPVRLPMAAPMSVALTTEPSRALSPPNPRSFAMVSRGPLTCKQTTNALSCFGLSFELVDLPTYCHRCLTGMPVHHTRNHMHPRSVYCMRLFVCVCVCV